MDMVKSGILAINLAIAGCVGGSVPKPDEIARMVEAGDVDMARVAIKGALEADPEDPDLILLKGRVAMESGNPDLAISELSRLADDKNHAALVRDHLARAYLMGGNPRRALETLGDGKPATALAFAVRTGALVRLGEGDAAAKALAEGLASFPDAPDLMVLEGGQAMAMGDIDKAAMIAGRAVKIAPGDVQVRLLAGRVAMIDRRFDEAQAHFDAVLARRPKFQTALLAKASMAMDRGDKAAADRLLREAAGQIGDGAPAIAYFRARVAYDDGRTDDALKILQSMGDTSAFPPATMLSGLVAARRGQHEQAIALLRRYLADGYEDGRARIALAVALDAVGERREAWATLRPVANAGNATPNTLELAARLAEASGASGAPRYRQRAASARRDAAMGKDLAAASAAMRSGEWAKADAIHSRLIAAHPGTDNVVLLNNAAFARLELGDTAGAVALGKRALALAPDDPVVLDTVAWAMFKAEGPTSQASALMRRAASAMPANVQIRRHALAMASAAGNRNGT